LEWINAWSIYALGMAVEQNSLEDLAVIRERSQAKRRFPLLKWAFQRRSLSSGFRNQGVKTGFGVLPVLCSMPKSKPAHWVTLAGCAQMAGNLEREQITWNSLKSICHRHPSDGNIVSLVVTGDGCPKMHAFIPAVASRYHYFVLKFHGRACV
jgi:hypothetical protein